MGPLSQAAPPEPAHVRLGVLREALSHGGRGRSPRPRPAWRRQPGGLRPSCTRGRLTRPCGKRRTLFLCDDRGPRQLLPIRGAGRMHPGTPKAPRSLSANPRAPWRPRGTCCPLRQPGGAQVARGAPPAPAATAHLQLERVCVPRLVLPPHLGDGPRAPPVGLGGEALRGQQVFEVALRHPWLLSWRTETLLRDTRPARDVGTM